jgi:hypothetical protein
MKLNLETVKGYVKPALNVVILVAVSTATFKLGALHQASKAEKAEVVNNPYAHAFTPDELSIAVNESNELIMIERKTGHYIVYSDAIGQTIFGMYANRLHQEANVIK